MFDRVIGYEHIKTELKMFYDLIVTPDKYKRLGIDTSKNVFLKNVMIEGPCGTGKTTICQDFLKEIENQIKTFFVVRDKYDGAFVSEINDIFRQARESDNGALIVFDDLNLFAINGDSEPIAAIKTGIDQCAEYDRIFCLATCNDSEDFSPAFIRRWKILQMLHPSKKDGELIIKHYLAQHPLVDDLNIEDICHIVSKFSCYELQNLIDSAAIFAAYHNKEKVDMESIKQVIMSEQFDLSSVADMNDEMEEETIIHECCHAVMMELLEQNSCGYIAISPVGTKCCGVTYSSSVSKQRQVLVLTSVASKVGVELLFGKTASGCQADIAKAIRLIREGITDNAIMGFDNCSVYHKDGQSETMINKIENAVHSELQRYVCICRKIFLEGDNLAFLKALAGELKGKRILLFSDIQRIKSHFSLGTYDMSLI